MRSVLRGLAGALAGLLLGVTVSLAVIVANARLRGHYLSGFDETVGWSMLPAVVGTPVGIWLAVHDGGAGRRVLSRALRGLTAGVALGASLGGAIDRHTSSAWAGGVMGAGFGVLIGAALGALPRKERRRDAGGRS
jgi:hypothetical protein